ncbi:unnamed protein product [Gongylonema pulchrum]|uniref:RING-type domain-containing protein n=1 Tax=Gongylonema pulchrum TaxID=637853 RepID=A0A183DU70_9BILA|nr:unnamed protein product [Gongylonema pulchrum]
MDSTCADGRFELSALQGVIIPTTFQALARRIRMEEIRSANIGNIESCPFCDFAAVLENQEDRIFHCLNPICQKESCRECHGESHVPLRCEEVEKDFETKKRKFIEERMSEAVIRKCPQCMQRECHGESHVPLRCEEVEKDFETKKRKFIEERMSEAVIRKCPQCMQSITKETGCNKMTCPCGTFFCYVCNAKLSQRNPYGHFDNDGCPQDTPLKQLHEEVARRAGLEALQIFHEENPETVNMKTPDIDQLSGVEVKKRKKPRNPTPHPRREMVHF